MLRNGKRAGDSIAKIQPVSLCKVVINVFPIMPCNYAIPYSMEAAGKAAVEKTAALRYYHSIGATVKRRDSGTPEGDWVAPFLERELMHGLKMIILDPMTTDRVRSYARAMWGRVTGTN